MTPEEAVNQFLKADMRTVTKGGLRMLFESVASTAHDKETRRCAAMLKSRYDALRAPGLISPSANAASEELERSRKELLRTGGLEVEQ